MDISTRPGIARATFSYNPQDPTVAEPATVPIDGVVLGDSLSTDKVKLRNLHLLTDPLGQPMGLQPDEEFKLEANEQGDFVYPKESEEFTSANAFATVARTVATFEKHLQEMTGKSLDWAFDEPHLGIAPHAGKKIETPFPNAFYTRFELKRGEGDQGNLFFFNFPNKDGQAASSANSGEVVSHEAGHAILDALKPNYFTSHDFEAGAFHEAFGDMVALLMNLEDKSVRQRVVEQNGGDLSQTSILSNLGEELDGALHGGPGRQALNSFVYVDPDTLEHQAPETELARESHSFGRVFTGAFYEILQKINEGYLGQDMDPDEALKKTGEQGWRLLIGQMENATDGSFVKFSEMADAMIQGDTDFNDGKHGEVLEQVFGKRNLLPGRSSSGGIANIMGLSLDIPTETGLDFDLDLPSHLAEMSFPLGDKFGDLKGVTVSAQHELNIFKSDDEELKRARLEKEIAHLAEHGEIFIPEPGQRAQLSDFIRADGSHYHAYLDRENNELKRVPLT